MQLRTEVSTYLSQIPTSTALSTYQSHQSTTLAFQSWLINQQHNPPQLTAKIVAEYATYQLERGYEPKTITGQACTLANLLAVIHKSDPSHEKARIAHHIPDDADMATQVKMQLAGTLLQEKSPNGVSEEDVEAFLNYLQRSEYGTRTHVYAALLYYTGSNPAPLQELNCNDISIESKTVTLNLPETHLPVSTGIHTTRTASIPANVAESISTYLEHERDTSSEQQNKPLFTTPHGRASSSTLRRSVKRASSDLSLWPREPDRPARTSEQGSDSETVILPSDIQWAGISKTLNEQ
ncbi:site-specific integrase [Natronolimnobius sp. AArcel1]|uniref:site-specific integrase n=1 Tax=Natronolimnobius sp. AArcel1 TaxID=1679093 RepID=UPI0013EA97BC|nr:site-specific integrase [Natronolimnobius sp. AArcel1]NGM70260.1 site-specific integrase [Natronolimnobius sp. AArcel1]